MLIQDIIDSKFVIELQEAINQLDEVFISNKAPNAYSIIVKVKTGLAIKSRTFF